MEPKDQRKVDDFIIFAMAAARQALDDANWHPSTEDDRCATDDHAGFPVGQDASRPPAIRASLVPRAPLARWIRLFRWIRATLVATTLCVSQIHRDLFRIPEMPAGGITLRCMASALPGYRDS